MSFFKPSEFASPDKKGSGAQMNPAFVAKLEEARAKCNFPWRVSSGYRTPAHNKKVGGAPSSYHVKGLAVDIACRNAWQRYCIVKSAIEAGIMGIEICNGHIHLDGRDRPCMWSDVSK